MREGDKVRPGTRSRRRGNGCRPVAAARLALLAASAWLFTASGAAVAKVNCNQVRLYLKTGRSVEDVAETMIIPVEEVKKCLEGGGGKEQPAPTAKPGS